MDMKGILISVEGPDGAGKTTQINLLKEYFQQKGYQVILTREPGGTAISEVIRGVILNPEHEEMCPDTELMLYTAARAQLVNEVIRPALAEGKVVICDRFIDSNVVYQGIARKLGIDKVYQVNDLALNGLRPDLTILLWLEAKEGLNRKKAQAELDRMEAEGLAFHELVANGYKELAKRNPERIYEISATLPVQVIHDKIKEIIQERMFNA